MVLDFDVWDESVTVDDARQDNVITPILNRVGEDSVDQQGLLHGMHAVCLLRYIRFEDR